MEIKYKRTPVYIHRSPYIDQISITGMSYTQYKKFLTILKLDKETIADYILEMVSNNSNLKNIHIQSKLVVQYVFCKILELFKNNWILYNDSRAPTLIVHALLQSLSFHTT